MKEMLETLALSCEGSMEVKQIKLTMFKCQYEIMVQDNKIVQSIIERLQVIINEIESLGKNVDSYDVIDKVLNTLPPQ